MYSIFFFSTMVIHIVLQWCSTFHTNHRRDGGWVGRRAVLRMVYWEYNGEGQSVDQHVGHGTSFYVVEVWVCLEGVNLLEEYCTNNENYHEESTPDVLVFLRVKNEILKERPCWGSKNKKYFFWCVSLLFRLGIAAIYLNIGILCWHFIWLIILFSTSI